MHQAMAVTSRPSEAPHAHRVGEGVASTRVVSCTVVVQDVSQGCAYVSVWVVLQRIRHALVEYFVVNAVQATAVHGRCNFLVLC